MEGLLHLRAEGLAAPRSPSRIWGSVFLLGLVLWQGWMTLGLMGTDRPWERLLDDQPIISGRHPLHLYHGYLGAQSLRDRGTLSCYDPAFQAGYLKTPVFDNGSRPAELFLGIMGGAYRPTAYKLGLALCCLAAPFPLFVAARGSGLERPAACLATALGTLVWWGVPGRQLLEAGDLDVLLVGLAALAWLGLLTQFHRVPSFRCWLGVLASGALGWFAEPCVFVQLLPLLLIYYLSVGTRHGLAWHVALLAGLAGSLLVNLWWLPDWLAYCWVRSPLQADLTLLPHRTLHTVWASPLWGEPADRLLAAFLFTEAAAGIWVLNESRQRPSARLLGLGMVGFLSLALAGIAWEPLGRLGTGRLLVLALWFAALPAAQAVVYGLSLGSRLIGGWWRAAGLAALTLGGVGFLAKDASLALLERCYGPAPLMLGLRGTDQKLLEALSAHTTPERRILWEDREEDITSRWPALLPLLTGRAYLGGLDPEATTEFSHAGLRDQKLAGRPLGLCSDADLHDFCRLYHVGWVVCRTLTTDTRFRAWGEAVRLATSTEGEPWALYQVPSESIALKGQARLVSADFRHIALADVIPEDGQVVLSLHYQKDLQASPGRVQIEKEPDPHDPIPFIRLRVSGPVARVTLTWPGR
jgi:hypothetical protein